MYNNIRFDKFYNIHPRGRIQKIINSANVVKKGDDSTPPHF